MIEAVPDLWPVLALVSGLLLALPLGLAVREGRGGRGTWTAAQGRILEVRKSRAQLDDDPFDRLLREHYLVLCRYQTAAGQVLTGWAGRRSVEPLGRRGDLVPLWYANDDPRAFTIGEPRSAPWPDVLVTAGVIVISATLAASVFTLTGIA